MYDSQLLGQTEYVRKEITKFLLNNSNQMSFLSNESFNKSNAPEFIFKPFKTSIETDFWNMEGRIVYFKITPSIETFFSGLENIENILQMDNNTLENLTLYKNGKVIFSVCTHEGYVYFDESIKEKLKKHYIKVVQNDRDFIFTKNKYLDLKKSNQYKEKEIEILHDIKNYVDEAKQAFIYLTPRHKCSVENYKLLFTKYMPDYIYPYFNLLHSFDSFDMYIKNIPQSFYAVLYYYSNINELLSHN